MITGLRGTLESMGGSWAVLAIGGVSLRVNVPSSTLSELGPIGSHVRLYTRLVV
ncbi:MAG: Holliday junction branch migration protein RuvA, partial [Chloroflexi bacterium]|nr:Holliday junction branch migration protein RuvA [Chloroflexota bacterium]